MIDLIEAFIRVAVTIGMLVYIWKLKWQSEHPRPLKDPVGTEAEITFVQFRKKWLWSPKEEAKATIYANYSLESGKKYTGQLATYPIRKQLDMYAPELTEKGTKVQIRYERKHRGVFYFTDPRYAVPEVSGEPRRVRISYFTLALLSLLITALSVALIIVELYFD